MKDQLRLLIELQVHDAKIQELEAALKAYPAQFEAAQTDVRRVETMLEKERSQLSETETWRKRQQDDAREQEDALIRAKQRSSMVKNVKEHMANERELEANRKSAQAREDEAKRLAEAVETAKKSLTQHEADLAAMKSHVAEEESAARGKMGEIEAQIAGARSGRDEAASRVDPAALKRYSTIRMRRGMALAAVKSGTCQGCHMNIPPQLFNILQRGLTIETCPTCNRIIYWDRLLADPDGAASEKAAKPAEKIKADKPKTKRVPAQTGPITGPSAATTAGSRPAYSSMPVAPKGPVKLAPSAGSEPGAMSVPNAADAPSSAAALPSEDGGDEPEEESSPSV